MLLNKPQTTAIKQFFFILLVLALFDIVVDVILRIAFDFSYDSLAVRLAGWIKYNIPAFIFWFFIRKNISNKKAADIALIALGAITLVRLFDIFFGFLVGQFTPYPILNTLLHSLPFLAFGFVYHKNVKGLWYFLIFLIISGIGIGSAYQINEFVSDLFRYRPWRWLGNLLSYSDGPVYLAPMPMLYYKLIFIVEFVVFFYMHYAIKSSDNKAFQFKKLDVKPISNLVFSIVFWSSRLVIITMIFGLVRNLPGGWGVRKGNIQIYIWVVSVVVAAYFFSLIYRNFLTSYFVSKGIKPGWKYILINLPIINFFVWLYITFFVTVPAGISLTDRVDKVTALFKNSDRNNNIKTAFYVVAILGMVIRLLTSRGRLDPILISLISGVLGIAVMALYFKYARTALVLFGLNTLILLAIPFAGAAEASPVFLYSMIYTLLWISIFHFDKYDYVNDLSLNNDGLGHLGFIRKDIKPFEPKELSKRQNTYWMWVFVGLLAAISIKIILLIGKTDFGFSYFRDGPVLRLLGSIFILTIVVIYANNINTAIKKKAPLSKTTKVLEIISYGIGLWYVFAILGGFISVFMMVFGNFSPETPRILLAVAMLILNIVLAACLIQVFIARYRFIGSYETSFNQMEFVAKNLSVEKLKSQKFSTLEDRLVLCKTCTNRKLTADGLVCSLTLERPTFEVYCADYNADERQVKRQNELKPEGQKSGFFGSWKGALVMSLLGFIRAGLAGFDDPFGLIFLILGVSWLIAALVSKKD